MPRKFDKNLIVGLDIGTSKVVAVIADISSKSKLDIIGFGTHASNKGIKKGVVVDIDATVQAIQHAVEDAEYMAGCEVHSVVTGISGSHIRSFNSNGIVPIRDHEVTLYDVERVIDAAKAVLIPADQKILHILPQEFMVDSQAGVQLPMGMSGVRLEANVHMITGSLSAAQNIVTCVRRCGLEVEDMVLQPIASSLAVLTEDEKQLGVCLIDIGGGTTDIAVYLEGAIHHSAVIPVAGDQVTNDIAVALKTPFENAEQIKIENAVALARLADYDEMIEVSSVGDRANKLISQVTLAKVIEPRLEELFSLVQAELRYQGLEQELKSGIVLTGGCARMEGIFELAEGILGLPVRLGVPRNVSGLVDIVNNPAYATGVGLLQYGYQSREQRNAERNVGHSFKGAVGRLKNWFQGNF